MGKKKKGKQAMPRRDLARMFSEMLSDNETHMGEGAAYLVTCEQLGVDPDDGYDLLSEAAESEKG